jgi:predicted methyltransferase
LSAFPGPRKGGASALRWLKCGLTALLLLGNVSCGSSMRPYQGHVVFNPLYLFYLESPSRDRWQKPAEVLQALQLAQGHVVADIGAGGGYFTEKLQQRVGPAGHVYTTDVQEVMLKKLRKRFAQPGHANVTVIHATFDDPRLPPGACDLALFSSVYKEIQGREAYMKKVRNALKPGGRVAILEYRPDDRSPGPPRRYRLPESQVIAEMQAAGFVLRQRFDFLPREYFLVFGVGR